MPDKDDKDDKDPKAAAVASIEAALADESGDRAAGDYDHDQADGRERTEVEQVFVRPDGSPDGLAERHFVHRVLDHNPERAPDDASLPPASPAGSSSGSMSESASDTSRSDTE